MTSAARSLANSRPQPPPRAAVWQLKVELRGTDVWRRFLVPNQITMARLHLALQAIMGWDNSHLYEFEVGRRSGRRRIGDPQNRAEDANKIELRAIASRAGARFTYLYDFGDSWAHEVLLEKTVCPEADPVRVVCVGGDRACPPEDCGGVWGYQELMECLANPDLVDEECGERLEWLGDGYDPEHFDADEVTRSLAGLDPLSRRPIPSY